jgi:hypothetical protein
VEAPEPQAALEKDFEADLVKDDLLHRFLAGMD